MRVLRTADLEGACHRFLGWGGSVERPKFSSNWTPRKTLHGSSNAISSVAFPTIPSRFRQLWLRYASKVCT